MPFARLSLAGDGLLERMRSTAFALLGIVAAMGLGLVAIIAQQEWSSLPDGPVPALYEGRRGLGNAEIVAPAGFAADRRRAAADVAIGTAGAVKRKGADSAPSGLRHAASPAAPSDPGGPEAAPQEPPSATPAGPQPASPAPAPAPAAASAPAAAPAPVVVPRDPATSPPAATAGEATSRGQGNAYAKGKSAAHGREKTANPVPSPAPVAAGPPTRAADDPVAKTESAPAERAGGSAGQGQGHAYGRAGK